MKALDELEPEIFEVLHELRQDTLNKFPAMLNLSDQLFNGDQSPEFYKGLVIGAQYVMSVIDAKLAENVTKMTCMQFVESAVQFIPKNE